MLKYNILENLNVTILIVYIFICISITQKFGNINHFALVYWIRKQQNIEIMDGVEIQIFFAQITICQNFLFFGLFCCLGHLKNISSCTAGETWKIIKVLNMLFIQVTKLGNTDLCLHFGSCLNLFTSSKQISYSWELENLSSEDLLCLLNTFAVVHQS